MIKFIQDIYSLLEIINSLKRAIKISKLGNIEKPFYKNQTR